MKYYDDRVYQKLCKRNFLTYSVTQVTLVLIFSVAMQYERVYRVMRLKIFRFSHGKVYFPLQCHRTWPLVAPQSGPIFMTYLKRIETSTSRMSILYQEGMIGSA